MFIFCDLWEKVDFILLSLKTPVNTRDFTVVVVEFRFLLTFILLFHSRNLNVVQVGTVLSPLDH